MITIIALRDQHMNTKPLVHAYLNATISNFIATLTRGRKIIQGRVTHEQQRGPLYGCDNWVMSRDSQRLMPRWEGTDWQTSVCCNTVDNVLSYFGAPDVEEVFILGGNQMFAEFMRHAHKLVIINVHTADVAEVPAAPKFPTVLKNVWRPVAHFALPPALPLSPVPYVDTYLLR